MDVTAIFILLLFFVALLYASVGHGGASAYLALMALFSIAPGVMKPTALLLNLFVSLTSFLQFYRGGYFRWSVFWPFALTSIPLAYIGGQVEIDAAFYKKTLGLLLLLPVIRFFFFRTRNQGEQQPSNPAVSLLIGGVIGFLSGLTGIGGGILLSPTLLLLKWSDQKQTAAISALFVFVNSFAGLAGQFTTGIQFVPEMYTYVLIAFSGGLCGAYYSALRLRQTVLRNILATVLLLAVFKLLFTPA